MYISKEDCVQTCLLQKFCSDVTQRCGFILNISVQMKQLHNLKCAQTEWKSSLTHNYITAQEETLIPCGAKHDKAVKLQ